jgi:anti-sigma regulatory factor (Ser/Thr protein kinase)
MEAHLQITFEPMWPNVREIRQRVGIALEECPAQLRSAAIMTASELVENAIKYGERVAAAKTVTFVLEATSDLLLVRVVNGSTNAAGVAELQRRVQELRGAADKQALYLARLEQLLADAGESGKLGIYRIGFEGGFDLELEYTNDVVTVTATRKSNGNG